METLDKYLVTLQESMTRSTINIKNETFELNIKDSDFFNQEIEPKVIKKILKQIQKDYKKYKTQVLKFLKEEHDDDIYNINAKNVRNIKSDSILIDVRGHKPWYEIYWKLVPPAISVSSKGKKNKIELIGLEVHRNITIHYVIPFGYHY